MFLSAVISAPRSAAPNDPSAFGPSGSSFCEIANLIKMFSGTSGLKNEDGNDFLPAVYAHSLYAFANMLPI
jgi:hypothetical protein